MNTNEADSRITLFTHRHRAGHSHVSRCVGYEFEDVVNAVDEVSVVAPSTNKRARIKEAVRQIALELGLQGKAWGRRLKNNRFYKRFGTSSRGASIPSCELFVSEVLFADGLLALESVPDWRKQCKHAACWIEEMWLPDVEALGPHLDILRQFDHIFCSCAGTTKKLADRMGKPVTYVPPGVDALRFCPYPDSPPRVIEVCNVGRRSPITHEALLNYAEQKTAFYYYDTLYGQFDVADPRQHRQLYANIVKHSRFFIANQAKFNSHEETAGQSEIGYRFFEGLAGGAVLLGDHPQTDTFEEQLGWEDAVIQIPFDFGELPEMLASLSEQPDRLETIRRRNVVNILQRHDWLYRWAVILDAFGLPHTDGMREREKTLRRLAAQIQTPSASCDGQSTLTSGVGA